MSAPFENAIGKVIAASISSGAYKATCYRSPNLIIRATRRHKPDKRNNRNEFILTIGNPNFAERKFVKKLLAAKEPFPVAKIQLKFYPKKKSKAE